MATCATLGSAGLVSVRQHRFPGRGSGGNQLLPHLLPFSQPKRRRTDESGRCDRFRYPAPLPRAHSSRRAMEEPRKVHRYGHRTPLPEWHHLRRSRGAVLGLESRSAARCPSRWFVVVVSRERPGRAWPDDVELTARVVRAAPSRREWQSTTPRPQLPSSGFRPRHGSAPGNRRSLRGP